MNENDFNNEYSLRRKWNDSDYGSSPITAAEMYKILRRNSLISRMRRRAFCIFVLGCTGPVWIEILKQIMSVNIWLQIYYIAFMFLAALGELYWWFRLGKVYSYMTIPLMQAQQKMEELSRLRKCIKYSCWIIGAPLIALYLYEIYQAGGKVLIYPAIIGSVIGLVIGLTLEYRNRKEMKDIKKSFAEFNDSQEV